jgi:hypothetical protein
MEFLKQDWSGRVYVKTDVLAQRKDMEPYEWPGAPPMEDAPDAETQEVFCKRVFGRHISRVTKKDIEVWTGVDMDLRKSKGSLLRQAMGESE